MAAAAYNAHTISIRRALIGGEACGVDPIEVCEAAHLPDSVLPSLLGGSAVLAEAPSEKKRSAANNLLPYSYYSAVWSYLTSRVPETKLSLTAIDKFCPEGFGPICFAAVTAPTLYDSIRQVLSHFIVLTNRGVWEERVSADEVTFIWRSKVNCSAESSTGFANILGTCRGIERVAGSYAPVIKRYHFKLEKPSNGPDLSSELDVEVRFGVKEDSFTVSRDKLDIIPPFSNSPMNAFFIKTLKKEVSDLHLERDIVVQLRDLMSQLSDFSDVTLDSLSDELKVSSRTLHRRLDLLDTSFSSELDDARKARALKLITTGNESMLDIAYSLGFSSSSSFTRAFKRWYQATPLEIRQKVAGN